MINAFQAQFEGEAVRVDVAKKTKAINEGRRFVAAVNKAREAGEETFEFDGKTYKVTKKTEKINEAEIKDDESFKEYVKAAWYEATNAADDLAIYSDHIGEDIVAPAELVSGIFVKK